MDSGYYAAMTGLVARTQALDTAAANLANAQTPGYRAEREYFRSALLGPDALDSQLGRTVNNFGLLGGDELSMAQGALQQTGKLLMASVIHGTAVFTGHRTANWLQRPVSRCCRRPGNKFLSLRAKYRWAPMVCFP
jgi:flagellar basal-body rod protein FlgF/flagellar basal-body rod protein FlgG